MNNQHRDMIQQTGDAELRMALRGLRQELAPGHDLWPAIAARIQSMPQQASPQPVRYHTRRLWPFAVAASMLLAMGVAWQLNPSGTPAASNGQAADAPTLVQREAAGMTVQYRAALRELESASVPANWQPGFEALDRSAAEIRSALQQDPDSRLLLERLRHTYIRRLALARRAIYA